MKYKQHTRFDQMFQKNDIIIVSHKLFFLFQNNDPILYSLSAVQIIHFPTKRLDHEYRIFKFS